VAQRLVRKLCSFCRQPAPVPEHIRTMLPDNAAIWHVPAGCAACDETGYSGRTGIFEVLEADDAIREAIASGVSSATLAHIAAERGHRSLHHDAADKIVAGITSFNEVERVVGWWVR
jgi:type II secretory ATPase GspE/PulE/Tfp pilus assembly ATPase PilB-like protein